MTGLREPRRPWVRRLAVTLTALLVLATGFWGSPVPSQSPEPTCLPRVAGGRDYHGLVLKNCNFNGSDLAGANFTDAVLNAVVFVRANLAAADFSGATIADSGHPLRPTDFTYAVLTKAKFIGAKFLGPTYFTYATLTCADLSGTDISKGTAIFGEGPLRLDTQPGCKTRFQRTVMNCEFVAQWNELDLSYAVLDACAAELQTSAGGPGHDFSNGVYTGVAFDGLNLASSKWTGASLKHASFQGSTLDGATGLAGAALWAVKFNNASVQNVDLGKAELYGAQFTNADLSESSLAGAFLTARPDPDDPIRDAASFEGAHLRNANLAGARLNGANFQYASFYGTFGFAAPSFPCNTVTAQCPAPKTGFTCACATASGADLTLANFSGAYLFGVDFSGAGTKVNGTLFSAAVLTGASFDAVAFESNGGAPPDFTKALLQGVVFQPTANLVNASFLNAFLDFGTPATQGGQGNILYLRLTADYTRWKGWSGSRSPCVELPYNPVAAVPANASMTCPNGNAGVCGAGRTPTSLANWKSGLALSTNAPVAGWYQFDATYEKAPTDPTQICGNVPVDTKW